MIDSATALTALTIAGKTASQLADMQGQAGTANLIAVIAGAVCSVVSFIFGHSHGKKAAKK